MSNARNKGILKAHNNWLAFLDSDDQWLPNKIKLQVEKIKNCQDKPLLVHTNELWIKDGNILKSAACLFTSKRKKNTLSKILSNLY